MKGVNNRVGLIIGQNNTCSCVTIVFSHAF